MNTRSAAARAAASLGALAMLAACGKVQEAASERVVEKAIESSMAKDGTTAKVDLSGGGMKISTTDASGKTTQLEMNQAPVSEADLGLPFYPGSKPVEGSAMRMSSGNGSTLQLGLHSDDAPDKVAAFYRDRLKAMSAGKQLVDMSSGDGAALSLLDDKAKRQLQVHVGKDERGSSIVLHSTSGF